MTTAVTAGREALSEAERHALAHATYACSVASNDEPEVSFDYELVQTLLSLIERLRLAAKPADELTSWTGSREITQALLQQLFNYDPETGVFTRRVRIANAVAGTVAGFRRHDGYINFQIFGKKCQAHRLAWLYVHGVWPAEELDHINGDPSDNRIANLRLATPGDNKLNRPVSKTNTSGFKGVTLHNGKWLARIRHKGKRFELGRFDAPEMAARAYDAKALEIHGEFAALNFPPSTTGKPKP